MKELFETELSSVPFTLVTVHAGDCIGQWKWNPLKGSQKDIKVVKS